MHRGNIKPLYLVIVINRTHLQNSNNTFLSADEKTYAVPGSDITLRVRWWNDRPINHKILGAYLSEMQIQVMQHIAENRDSSLAKFDDDPYRRRGIGFYAIFSSTPSPSRAEQHLTYKYLFETLEGLYDVMFVDNHPDGSYTTITHEILGVLGTAVILPKDPVLYDVATA